ncbi:MAG: hypothetical protein Kow0040_18260 [Thermogutta sp.]
MTFSRLLILAVILVVSGVRRPIVAESDADTSSGVLGRWEVDRVWAGHPVGFFLLTAGQRQYVAYYDADRVMTVASRELSQEVWTRQKLDSKVGWDSHNGIVMARDTDGRLHLAGNVHVQPLVYFRTAEPDDITTFQAIHRMVGRDEQRCTYPRFISRPDGTLIFFYRDGASGRGRQFFNVYEAASQTWRRLFDEPMWDGGEEKSAYPSGPILGPDGWWHVCWMWRDTPDCATNHTLCYARSPDLEHWETVSGRAIALPITPDSPDVIVDGTPVGGGMINMGHHVGFDHERRPILSYHRYDDAGRSQIFAARWEAGAWKIRALSDWDYRWEFSGGGSIGGEISAGPIRPDGPGLLQQEFHHSRYGSGMWLLDEETLAVREVRRITSGLPDALRKVESSFPGMQVRIASDAGSAPRGRYILRWETLPPNRDRPRDPPYPPPSRLEVILLGNAE